MKPRLSHVFRRAGLRAGAIFVVLGIVVTAGVAQGQSRWRPKPPPKPAPTPPVPTAVDRVGQARWSTTLGFVQPADAPSATGAPAGNVAVPAFAVTE